MQLAHPGDDGLAGLLVRLDAEGRILLGQLLERVAELLLVGLGLRLDRHRDDRLREVHRLEHDRVVGSRRACRRSTTLRSPTSGADLAGVDLLDLLALVGVHAHDPADPLAASASPTFNTVSPVSTVPE